MKTFGMGVLLLLLTLSIQSQDVYINELRADDASTDDGEFIEIVGPAGTDITGYVLEHFNGTGSGSIFSFTFPADAIIPDDGYIDDQGRSIGFLVVIHPVI